MFCTQEISVHIRNSHVACISNMSVTLESETASHTQDIQILEYEDDWSVRLGLSEVYCRQMLCRLQ